MAAATSDEANVTLRFHTSRLGVHVSERAFAPQSTIGEVHARVRNLVRPPDNSAAATVVALTYLFINNGTECFIPSPSHTVGELFALYGVEGRILPVTVDTEVFSG